MAFALNDNVLVKFFCSFGSQISVNVRKFRVTAVAGGGPSIQAVADQLSVTVSTLYQDVMPVAARYEACSVQKVDPPASDPVFSTNGAGPGAAPGEPLPPQTCGIFTLTTGFAGRSARGRQYIPFPYEDANDLDGKPIAGYIADMEALAVFFSTSHTVIVGAASVSITPVLHFNLIPAVPITGYVLRGYWATQRRRSFANRPDAFLPA